MTARLRRLWRWLWYSAGTLLVVLPVLAEEPGLWDAAPLLSVYQPSRLSTGTLHLRLVVPEGGVEPGTYRSLTGVRVDLPAGAVAGEHDLRLGPAPTPDDCPDCPPCPAPPPWYLVRLSRLELYAGDTGAWTGRADAEGTTPMREGLWRCSPPPGRGER